ncbi:MAG: 1,4-alpha-glucan branching protein GlgB [Alphaproteobacteria bacterium]|nr:1,4-alpha-glucan branching protein GlgB [Alphaproteobacteria bacterium]
MRGIKLTTEELDLIARGMDNDPFGSLGLHKDEKKKVAIVRAFKPYAKSVAVVIGDKEFPMKKLHAWGVFEAAVPMATGKMDYMLNVDGVILRDEYSFDPTIGELDSHLMLEGKHYRLQDKLGAHLIEHQGVPGVAFAVWAPNAYRVSVIGEFNKWDGRANVMRRHPVGGLWDIFIPLLGAGALYRFEVLDREGKLLPLRSDPFARHGEVRPANASRVWKSQYEMQNKMLDARHSINEPISIYEVHLGSFKRRDGIHFLNWDELAVDVVDYVHDMGFTHIELMPITEHPLDESWGYQPTGMFAPTSRFGDPDGLKRFVDAAHAKGLKVIVDWVPAHFPRNDFALARFDGKPIYEYEDSRKGEHQDWGTLIYDYGRNEVVNFLISSAKFFIEEYGIDGLRFDAVASMLYLDYSRQPGQWVPNVFGGNGNLEAINFLRNINTVLYREHPHIATFAEESTGWGGVSAPASSGGLGFGFKWNMGWMNDTLEYMKKDPVHRKYEHHKLVHTASYAFYENFVLPLSHDEVVHGKGSLLGKMPGDRWQKFANLRALYAYMWAFPGRKLLFMGGEFAQEREWSATQSLDWHLLADPMHRQVQSLVRDLNNLYRNVPALHRRCSEGAGFRWINFQDADNSILSFVRQDSSANDAVMVVSNFTPIVREGYRIGVPAAGVYEVLLNTDDFKYGGSGAGNWAPVESARVPCGDFEHSIVITVPPLAVVYFKKKV